VLAANMRNLARSSSAVSCQVQGDARRAWDQSGPNSERSTKPKALILSERAAAALTDWRHAVSAGGQAAAAIQRRIGESRTPRRGTHPREPRHSAAGRTLAARSVRCRTVCRAPRYPASAATVAQRRRAIAARRRSPLEKSCRLEQPSQPGAGAPRVVMPQPDDAPPTLCAESPPRPRREAFLNLSQRSTESSSTPAWTRRSLEDRGNNVCVPPDARAAVRPFSSRTPPARRPFRRCSTSVGCSR